MERITTCEAGRYAERRIPFQAGKGPTLYGNWEFFGDGLRQFVVYSYGKHFPLYIYHEPTGEWFGNADKYSVTMSRHQRYANPRRPMTWRDTEMMLAIAVHGFNEAMRRVVVQGMRRTA